MPNVQSKETLLTEFDYNRMFAKRTLESNWSKYDELPDDEDNEQMLAANFEEMLLGPKSVGGHFTFSSERHWNDLDAQQPSSAHEDLFKMDLNLLKNGLSALPFDVRLGYDETLFDSDELADITIRAGCTDVHAPRQKTQKAIEDVDLITEFERIDKLKIDDDAPSVLNKHVPELRVGSNESKASSSNASQKAMPPPPLPPTTKASPAKVNIPAQSIDNIQGWLDDLLNNG